MDNNIVKHGKWNFHNVMQTPSTFQLQKDVGFGKIDFILERERQTERNTKGEKSNKKEEKTKREREKKKKQQTSGKPNKRTRGGERGIRLDKNIYK